jgi:regulator of replication initiation timing
MSREPLIDLRTVSPDTLKPIRSWANDYLAIPRSEHRLRLFGAEFTICCYRRDPLIFGGKLEQIFDAHGKVAEASARVLRQQTRELEARQERDLAQSRTDFLASLTAEDRGLLAARLAARAETDARVARGYDLLLAEKVALAAKVEELQKARRSEPNQAGSSAQEKNALRRQIDQLVADRMRLLGELGQLRVHLREQGERADQALTAAESLITDREQIAAKQIAVLTAERDALKRERGLLATTVHNLMVENRRLGNRLSDARAHAASEAKTGARARQERDALRAEVVALQAAGEQLKHINDWLRKKLSFRNKDPRAA